MMSKHRGLFFCLLALLVWLPWPLGGNRPWAWPVMCLGVLTVLAFWSVFWLRQPYPLPIAVKKAKIPLYLMAGWLAFLLLQTIPIPASLLNVLSPSSATAYNGLEAASGYASISVDRAATFSEFIKSSTYIALFFLVLVLVEDQRRLKKLIVVIVVTAVVQCLYGMMSVGTVMGYVKAAHDTVSGSYPNRDHFAGFMTMAISLSIGLFMVQYFEGNSSSSLKRKLLKILDSMMGPEGLKLIFIAILFTGLMLSESRGGFIAFLLSFIAMFIFVLPVNGLTLNRRNMIVSLLVIAVLGTIVLNSYGLFFRLTGGGTSGSEFVWDPGVIMAKDYVLFGSGLGTFQSAFPFYYPMQSQTWWHAHMNYLELFIEQGLFGFILFASCTVSVIAIILRSFLQRRNGFSLGIMFGVLMGITSILLHEMVDYHFYIPANAGYFYVLLAIGVVAASLERPVET